MITALIIFIITYLFIGLRQVPRLHINRPAGALVGAVLMIVFGVLSLDQAFGAIDLHTLLLLLGMMITTVYLRVAGFFELIVDRMLSLSKTPLQLLIVVVLSSGLLFALFVNDTICLLYTPIVLEVTVQLGVNPMPYSLVAAAGAVLLLVFGGVSTEQVLEGVDWTLLLFFSGLFVVMHGVEASGLAAAMIEKAGNLTPLSPSGRIAGLSAVAAILSNLVSNVPAVMLLKPLTLALGSGHFLWLALAMSSTLAGNLTLIGSVANLIVVQQARKHVEIGFMEYFRVGALITVMTLAIGILVLVAQAAIASNAESPAVERPKQQSSVTITPADLRSAPRTFSVVLTCDTDEKRTSGLQGFRWLRANEAALFVFERPEVVRFWMGSVEYPIDIVFIGPDKKVARVYENCKPGSRDIYYSRERAAWVIETAAGSGIRVGDGVRIEGIGTRVQKKP